MPKYFLWRKLSISSYPRNGTEGLLEDSKYCSDQLWHSYLAVSLSSLTFTNKIHGVKLILQTIQDLKKKTGKRDYTCSVKQILQYELWTNQAAQ